MTWDLQVRKFVPEVTNCLKFRTEARPDEDKGIIDMIYAIFDNLDSVEFESTSRSPTTVTPTKHLTSGEDFSDDTSPSSTLTTEDNYTEETPLYVTSTMENSFSEITSSSSTTHLMKTSTPRNLHYHQFQLLQTNPLWKKRNQCRIDVN
nr:hyp [Cotesia vestalis bracovirus]